MREMKNSGIEWIGEIPKNWKIEHLKHFVNFQTGGTPKNNEGIECYGDYSWFTPIDLLDNILISSKKYIDKQAVKDNCYNLFPNESILLCCIASVGKLGFNISDSYSNQQITALIPIGSINMKFLFYYLMFARYKIIFDASSNVVPIVNTKYLKNVSVCIPDICEQQRIASYLDTKCSKIDDIIEKQQSVIEKLKAYKESIITEAVTKGLNPDVPMKDSGVEWIGEVPEHWKVVPFKYVAQIKSNLVAPNLYEDFPQIGPDSIEKDSGKIILERTVKESGVESNNHLFFKGQIIYSKIRPTLNKVIIAPYDGLCSADMYPIETDEEVKYVQFFMLSSFFVKQVEVITRDRIKMPKINQEELGNILFVVPNEKEQKQIADYLDQKCSAIDSTIANKQALIEKLTAYKKSLIYEVVTGKKEV